MNLALFYVREGARIWAHWNQSFDMLLSDLKPESCFPSWILLGCTGRCGCNWLRAWRPQLHLFIDRAGNILCLQHHEEDPKKASRCEQVERPRCWPKSSGIRMASDFSNTSGVLRKNASKSLKENNFLYSHTTCWPVAGEERENQ